MTPRPWWSAVRRYRPRFFGARCERSDAAARFAAADAAFEASVLPAADAAARPVCLLFPVCAKSDAAARFAAGEAELERSVFPAAEAAAFPVLPAIKVLLSTRLDHLEEK
jgi:hypothetical protein